MKDDSVWPTVWEFACGCALVAMAAMGLAMLLGGCAGEPPIPPPKVIMVPHVCQPTTDSVFFQKCSADCPDGKAFIVENANDTACYCKKARDAM